MFEGFVKSTRVDINNADLSTFRFGFRQRLWSLAFNKFDIDDKMHLE